MSLSDILTTVQQGVTAANNLVVQAQGSFTNIANQLSSLSSQVASLSSAVAASSGVKSFNGRVGVVVPAQGDYPTSLIPGSTTNNNATAGNIGEFVSSVLLASVAVVAASGAVVNITSISLSAGDWDVRGNVGALPAGSLSILTAAVSTTSVTLPADNISGVTNLDLSFVAGTRNIVPVTAIRVNLASSSTVFLVGGMTSSGQLYGYLAARRMR